MPDTVQTDTPSVGRIVHFQTLGSADGAYAPEALAAIVTKVHSPTCVDLHVWYGNGESDKTSIELSDVPTPGRWNWPPRV